MPVIFLMVRSDEREKKELVQGGSRNTPSKVPENERAFVCRCRNQTQ